MKSRASVPLEGTAHAAWHGADLSAGPSKRRRMRGASAKRALDIATAAAMLLVLAPVFVACAAIAKTQSPGGVFFLGYRVGRFGRPFRLIKFRTMVADAPRTGAAITTAGDPRVTKAGRLLRRVKLDELPNLVNVLAGCMSIVGPRPESADHVALYSEADRRILSVRPGITGPTQIVCADEEQILAAQTDPETYYSEVLLPRKIASDLNYVDTRTFWRDIAVIVQTARLVFVRVARGGRE